MTTVTANVLKDRQNNANVNETFQKCRFFTRNATKLEAFLEHFRVLATEASISALPNDDVIDDRNLEHLPRRTQHPRNGIVLRGSLSRTRRMVMRKDDRDRIVLDGLRKSLPRCDRSLVH